ncbi:hypothetical protein [Psychroserpens luteus]|uniref:Outer membrane protein beta-barrel domain-containing protein n=1 Tax=Psychroserpens luteus TaxID=1434066 RepID=A0ABW5ZS87_9FLAO|nr:hypothetical protein [Psychroserpens luteus]
MRIKSTKLLILLITSLTINNIGAQDVDVKKYTSTNKGKFFISWGGNRESFSKSDIRFQGDNYDFTIKDASAVDKPKGWHIDYANPTRMTIPQTNFRLGYYISDHYTISLNVDHMKYVMVDNQTKVIDGYIDLPDTEVGSEFNGTYDNDATFVSEDFLIFEHTNGLNYVYAEFSRVDDISKLFGIQNTDIFQLNITEGVGGGVLYPKTNTTLLKKDRYDEFHLAGYGVSLNVGLNFTFFKHFYIQTDLRGGFINMNDIRTTSNTNEKASQHFLFLQRVISIGGIFRL